MTHPWQWMYPPLQSHAHGWLDVGEGHEIYWECSGNPLGAPALFVHSGPGAGCRLDDRRWFDPAHYRIVLFDQRGCGRSRPSGAVRSNTTAHLVSDIEALRSYLGVERWLLFGGSWGATLSLVYAQRHPDCVSAVVLRGVFTAAVDEWRWLYTAFGAAALYPEAWNRFTWTLPASQRAEPVAALAAQLHCGDPQVEQAAAKAWLRWEQDLMDFELNPSPNASIFPIVEDAAAVATARVGSHFARHGFFLEEGQLLRQAHRLRGIPSVIVQGARDRVTPPPAGMALHRAWPGSRWVEVQFAGHASSHGDIARELIAATDRFRALCEAPATT